MKISLFHRSKKTQSIATQNPKERIALYVPMYVPEKKVPVFLPDISGEIYPTEQQCRLGIAAALKSTYDSIANAFDPAHEKNLASRIVEYYSIGIERYFYGIRPTMDLYFNALGKQKDYSRISTLVKNSKQDLLLRFQQLLIKRADLYKLYPLDAYVDLALFCETDTSEKNFNETKSLCQPQPLQYKVISVTEPWNRLQQTKRKMFEDFAAEAYKIYKEYLFEIECLLSSSAVPAPQYADGKELEEYQAALAKCIQKHRHKRIAV